MKVRIAPSILSFDHSKLRGVVEEFGREGVDRIHFDVMDGQFVPPITFGDGLVAALRDCADVAFEAHLMTLSPERHFEAFAAAGCSRIYFHVEATVHAHRLVQALKGMGVEAGLALNPATPAEAAIPLLNDLDALLVMTVNPGWGGQKFIPSTLSKIRAIRDQRADLDIEVDGGIDPTTLPRVQAAGANLFVVGNFLVRSANIREGLLSLEHSCG